MVAGALSKSQKKDARDSMDELAVAVAAIKEQVLKLSGVSMDLTVEDLQEWTTIYQENPSQIAMYTKLHQGQNCKDSYLTPTSLMARMKGV